MTYSYEDASKILIDHGWTKIKPATFHKHRLELFFDNSHCAELYEIRGRKLIAESRITSAEALMEFLNNINWEA